MVDNATIFDVEREITTVCGENVGHQNKNKLFQNNTGWLIEKG